MRETKIKQLSMFGTQEFPSYEEIIEAYAKEFNKYVIPEGDTVFGFWMQTLADLAFLDLELQGLTEGYSIDPVKRTVDFDGDKESIRLRIAHLEKVKGKPTLYSELVDEFGDTNAYAFHNLYPFKGKFYPRVVRTLINTFRLKEDSLLLDPFNGCGTTTHEASLMGVKSVGIDITPMGTMLAEVKNGLLFTKERELSFSADDLKDVLESIERRDWSCPNDAIYNLMLIVYFDTVDALARTSRYDRKGKVGLFIEKFNYIKDCHKKLKVLKDKYELKLVPAKIIQGDALELKNMKGMKECFDAVITSPPYYFSIDYVGKDQIAYEYLGIDIKELESKYLGMKDSSQVRNSTGLPHRVITYYQDLRRSIFNIFRALKPGGALAIIVGDSTVNSQKIPTTMMTKRFCEEASFKFEKLVFNPLLGAKNRAIRGESVIICKKP